MRTALFLSCASLLAAPARQDVRIERIIDLSRSVPAEFGAQALLRVIESGMVTDEQMQGKLIEEAFEKASAARVPVARRVIPAIPSDDPVFLRAQGYGQGFDRLSLQTRAVRAMLPLNPKRALALFESIPYPEVPWRDCQEPTFEDVSGYFQTLAAVAPQAGRDADKLALAALSRIQSPAELAPAARMVQSVPMPQDSREVLAISLAAIRERVGSDSCLDAIPPNTVSLADAGKQRTTILRPEVESLRRRWLALMPGGGPVANQKNSTEWREAFEALVRDVEALTPPPQSGEAENLEVKCGLMALLYMAAPAGPLQDMLLKRYLEILRTSPLEAEDPLFWYSRVVAFYGAARPNNPEQREKLLGALEASGSPVLALYAGLERTLPAL
jgi:hypothetical protein